MSTRQRGRGTGAGPPARTVRNTAHLPDPCDGSARTALTTNRPGGARSCNRGSAARTGSKTRARSRPPGSGVRLGLGGLGGLGGLPVQDRYSRPRAPARYNPARTQTCSGSAATGAAGTAADDPEGRSDGSPRRGRRGRSSSPFPRVEDRRERAFGDGAVGLPERFMPGLAPGVLDATRGCRRMRRTRSHGQPESARTLSVEAGRRASWHRPTTGPRRWSTSTRRAGRWPRRRSTRPRAPS